MQVYNDVRSKQQCAVANAVSVHELLTAVSVFAEQEGRSLFFLTMAAGGILCAKIRYALQGRRYAMWARGCRAF